MTEEQFMDAVENQPVDDLNHRPGVDEDMGITCSCGWATDWVMDQATTGETVLAQWEEHRIEIRQEREQIAAVHEEEARQRITEQLNRALRDVRAWEGF